MNKYESFDKLMVSVENICGGFVIKDFVGFLNWEPTLGSLLLRYTGHHSAFCQSIKQEPGIYPRCVLCSTAHQRRCEQLQKPFSKACFLGISEYSVPIVIDRLCIGSVSVGRNCPDPADAALRLKKEAERFSLDFPLLKHLYDSSVQPMPPSQQTCAVFQFIAEFLAEEFRPYAGRASRAAASSDAGFELIQTYIFNNYTSLSISIASIAQACNYSQSYVSHIFKKKCPVRTVRYDRHNRIAIGHVQTVQYIAAITI